MSLALLAALATSDLRSNGLRKVAITIDDLPYVGKSRDFEVVRANTRRLLAPLRAIKAPVTGFVIGNGFDQFPPPRRRELYRLWLDAGFQLGNHTWTHANLDAVSLADFEAEISRTNQALKESAGLKTVRYFRAPYLNDGKDKATKAGLRAFLVQQNLTEAPVTLDSDEYKFAGPYDEALNAGDTDKAQRIEAAYVSYWRAEIEHFEAMSKLVLGRECAQILLIHANRLTATTMPRLLDIFRTRRYKLISLDEALKDPAYRIPDLYCGSLGLSWIYRWGWDKTPGLTVGPEVPSWLQG